MRYKEKSRGQTASIVSGVDEILHEVFYGAISVGHRCSTTKLIVVPSKEGGAMILGPCGVEMLIIGFLSELAVRP